MKRKQMKKITALLTAAVLSLGILAGCGTQNTEGEPAKEEPAKEEAVAEKAETVKASGEETVKITFWSHFGGDDGKYLNNMVAEYQALHPEVEIEHLEVTNEDYYTKFKTGIASGEGPDVSTGDANRLVEFKAAGLVEDITPYTEDAGVDWNSYNQNVLGTCTVDGEHLAIPLSSYVTIMFANKTLLEEAGMLRLNENGAIDFGSSPEEFIAFLEEYEEKKPDGIYTIVGGTTMDDPYRLWWSFYGQTGERLLNEEGTATNINSENSKKALKLTASLTERGLWPANIEDSDQVFLANKAAFYVSGNWWVGAATEAGMDFIAMPIPQVYDEPSAWGGTHVFYLNPRPGQTEEQKIEAVKFANWMACNSAEWTKGGHIPANNNVLESEEYKALEHRETYEMVNTYMMDLPAVDNVNAIVEVFRNNIPLAFNGASPVEDVLADCEQQINALLQ